MADYQLWLGDCLEEMDRIEDGSIDAIVADWPYGVTNCRWDSVIPLEPLWKQCKRVIKENGAIVLFGSEPFTSVLICSNLNLFRYKWVWKKTKATGFLDANKRPLNNIEDIAVFADRAGTYNPQMMQGLVHKRGTSTRAKRVEVYGNFYDNLQESNLYYPNRILEYAVETRPIHPTQKPTKLIEYLVKTYTNEGELILDNTFGSCTTGEACLRTGRRFIGIEKDLNYFEIGKARMERVAAELRGELNHLPMFAGVAA